MIATITDTISRDGINIASFEDKTGRNCLLNY